MTSLMDAAPRIFIGSHVAHRSAGLSLDHNITAIAVTSDGLHAAVGDESGRVHVLTLDVD
jgi:hypothetical protein